MQKTMKHIKYIGISALLMAGVDLSAVMGLAYAVCSGCIDLVHCEVLLLVLLIISAAFVGVLFGGSDCGGLWPYMSGVLFLLCALMVVGGSGCVLPLNGIVKSLLAISVGTFIGLFVKKLIHNKLRKNKKNRRCATK